MEVKTVLGKTDFEQLVHIGRHVLISDADVASGGQGKGPNPHDMLSASLAACTAITIKMYAHRKEIKLTKLEVMVEQSKNGEGALFTRKIKMEGDLNTETSKRLLEIAEKCPVHKVLSGKIEIRTVSV